MNTFDEILNEVFDIDDNGDGIEISHFVDKKNEAIKQYAKAWENFVEDDSDNIDLATHTTFLRAIRDISIMAEEYGLSAKVVSDDYVSEAISNYINNEFYDMVEMSENGYDWPYNHLEFDIDSAIGEKLDEADSIEIGKNIFYHLTDISDFI